MSTAPEVQHRPQHSTAVRYRVRPVTTSRYTPGRGSRWVKAWRVFRPRIDPRWPLYRDFLEDEHEDARAAAFQWITAQLTTTPREDDR